MTFQLLREAGTSVLEILKVDVVSFVYIPIQVSMMLLSCGTILSLNFVLFFLVNVLML